MKDIFSLIKEKEADPTIGQCWTCGELEPNHNANTCTRTQICLKCSATSHRFFACHIPRDFDRMTIHHKDSRFCAPCGIRGDHTSLDLSACPKKREIIRERARIMRNKEQEEHQTNKREEQLIKNVLDYANEKAWPSLKAHPQQHKRQP